MSSRARRLAWPPRRGPSADDLWSVWEFDPGVVIPLVVFAFLYARGVLNMRIASRREVICFWSGWATLSLALISPIHPLGEALFSAHMLQHETLMLIAAPLLVISCPLVTFLWALPFEWRREIGSWAKANYARRSWRWLTDPLTAWCLHAAAIWV